MLEVGLEIPAFHRGHLEKSFLENSCLLITRLEIYVSNRRECGNETSVSNPQCIIVVGTFKSVAVLSPLELDTCSNLTSPLPRESTTPFLRDALHPLVWILVEMDSHCSRIVSQNTPGSFKNPKSPDSHLTVTPLDMYEGT